LISLEYLADWGWIEGERIAGLAGHDGNVDFEQVEKGKLPLLYEAAGNFLDRGAHAPELAGQWQRFLDFCSKESSWLTDYALYAELRRKFNTGAWTMWPAPIRHREPKALAQAAAESGRALAQEQALQFAFAVQWNNLRAAAAQHKIRILGDVAIFVNMDSADVWMHPAIFELDEELRPTNISGVPPDYFSPTGQRWGNPLYRWDVLAEHGFDWWIDRIRRSRDLYDMVRLDHFRGFEAYWSIPADESTAINGTWVKAPGLELFEALEAALGPLPLVAEDLGLITPEVDALRLAMKMPGMRVLQFGFGDKGSHMHLPHQFVPGMVAYSGTHDNDTTQGWWSMLGVMQRELVETLLGPVNGKPAWPMIRAAAGSVAELSIFPVQDLLELGSDARMNTPAAPSGNWSWRVAEGSCTPEVAQRLAAIVDLTDRDNDPLEMSA
jgi:4-alpha-glucanotransferase